MLPTNNSNINPSKPPNIPNKATINENNSTKNKDEYAQALATMATLDYELSEKTQPEQKHFISKKMLIYIILSLIISIFTLLAGKLISHNNSPTQDDQTINELLQTTKDVRELENQ
jgi:hypothetical protein